MLMSIIEICGFSTIVRHKITECALLGCIETDCFRHISILKYCISIGEIKIKKEIKNFRDLKMPRRDRNLDLRDRDFEK